MMDRYSGESKSIDSFFNLLKSSEFLELNSNWALSTVALQLQEVSIIIVSKKLGIKLDKTNVERILGKQIGEELTFSIRYEAFSKKIKRLKGTDMPILATDLRKSRTQILHEGKNPTSEDAETIVQFTIDFLGKMRNLC